MTHDRQSWLRRSFLALSIAAVGAIALAAARAGAQDTPTADAVRFPRTIVVVRHGEKAAEPKEDPNLSEAGAQRAQRLSALFAKTGVTHMFASEYQRTQQTLAPLSVAAGINVQVVSAHQPAALASSLDSLPRGSVAVVAGHSNTVGPLVELLTGGRTKVKLDESEYDRIFLVTQWGPGSDARAIELRY